MSWMRRFTWKEGACNYDNKLEGLNIEKSSYSGVKTCLWPKRWLNGQKWPEILAEWEKSEENIELITPSRVQIIWFNAIHEP